MKIKLGILICMIFGLNLFAQESLVVTYDLEKKMDKDKIFSSENSKSNLLPENLKESLYEKFIEPQSYKLILQPKESSFEWIEKINNSQSDGIFSNISLGDIGLIYKNLEENIYEQEGSISSNEYIIRDSLKNFNWKITKETQEILGYETRKAETDIDSIKIIAWYATKLPYRNGPELYSGLPGLILKLSETKVSYKLGETTKIYKATSLKTDFKKSISKPKKGKIISKSEYEKLKKEYQEKRLQMRGEGVDTD